VALKQSFIKCFIYYLLRTIQVLHTLCFNPFLNQSKIIVFAHLPSLPLDPSHKMREQVRFDDFFVEKEEYDLIDIELES
jgi:hypothetical protein